MQVKCEVEVFLLRADCPSESMIDKYNMCLVTGVCMCVCGG